MIAANAIEEEEELVVAVTIPVVVNDNRAACDICGENIQLEVYILIKLSIISQKNKF